MGSVISFFQTLILSLSLFMSPTATASIVIQGTEPMVAVDAVTGNIAIVSQHIKWPTICSRSTVQISTDSGKTFGAPSYPFGSECQDIHAVIAYGANSRLWFVNAVGVSGGVKLAITYSDTQGKVWSKPFIEPWTKAWVGCFPMVAAYPDGSIYIAYNYPITANNPGVARIYSKDNGKTWNIKKLSVPVVNGVFERIGYRITSEYTSYVQSGRLYVVDQNSNPIVTLSGVNPWQTMIAQTPSAVYAIGSSKGIIKLASNFGSGWEVQTIAQGFSPVIATKGNAIFVGWHKGSTVINYYKISYDGGKTWLPTKTAGPSWHELSAINGSGLRENALWSNNIYWTFGTGDKITLITIHTL